MKLELSGTTALVTGASSGIGRSIAVSLGPKVSALILVARRVERLEALATELRGQHAALEVRVEPCDLSDPTAVSALVGRVGAVDVLINNAGLGDIGLFERQDWAKTERMLRVNINALTQLTRQLLPGMLERGRGGVLNISSSFGLAWLPGAAAYGATKHYVTAFSEALRLELKGTGVVVTQSCPGPVATEFEGVAGNPTGQSVPRWIEIGPDQCAAESVAALEKGRAMVVTGFAMKLMMLFVGFVPRWTSRLALGWIGGWLRKRSAA